jgi:hypothetical protein
MLLCFNISYIESLYNNPNKIHKQKCIWKKSCKQKTNPYFATSEVQYFIFGKYMLWFLNVNGF